MNLFGIKFAPLIIPLERRLQTLAAGAWFITMAFGGLISIIITAYILFFTQLCWLIIIYLMWIIYDKDTGSKGGRRLNCVRNLKWWRYFSDYFPLSVIKTAELSPDRNYILAAFPHGILCTGIYGNFATDASEVKTLFPGITPYVLTLDVHFITPFFRELALGLGACSVSKKSLLHLLEDDKTTGKAAVILIGGAEESLFCRPGTYKIVLKNRKGFIKIAIQTGTPIVPVFSFGETDLFDQVDNPPGSHLLKLQNIIRKMIGIAPCIPIGRGIFQYNFGLIPRRRPVVTVVGSPITVKKKPEPCDEDIENLHNTFILKITELFENYKHKYIANPEEAKLIIV